MDNIGDYIYLIIIAIAGLSSLFKKKNKDGNTAPKPKSIESEDLGDVLREIFGEKPERKPEVVYNQPEPETKKTKVENIASYENTSDISALKAKKEVTRPATIKTVVQIEEEEIPDYSISSVEEARAAFISAEIFNRKY